MGRGSNDILGGDTSHAILAQKADELFARIRGNFADPDWHDPDDYIPLEIVHDILIYLAMDTLSLSVQFPSPTEIRGWINVYFKFYDDQCIAQTMATEDRHDIAERREKLMEPFASLLSRSLAFHGKPK
jgi:hypothetical protein